MNKLKTLLFASTLLVGFNSVAMAQSDDATITANANVIDNITVTSTSNLDFGDILVGTSKTMDAANQSVSTTNGVTGNETFGAVDIETANANIKIEIEFPDDLTGQSDANNTLPFIFSGGYAGGQGAEAILVDGDENYTGAVDAGLTQLQDGGSFDWGYKISPDYDKHAIDDFPMPASGSLTVIIGGTVTAASDQSVEQYQGDFTVTSTVAD
ncbi:hypothetical protein [Gracilimonas halophila]|uniref:DUF4402 domain-containing protein n=1 Tax=Gracilimonas halophila TaxID=1834464 RepID=A0ABW5JKB0_9BACT